MKPTNAIALVISGLSMIGTGLLNRLALAPLNGGRFGVVMVELGVCIVGLGVLTGCRGTK